MKAFTYLNKLCPVNQKRSEDVVWLTNLRPSSSKPPSLHAVATRFRICCVTPVRLSCIQEKNMHETSAARFTLIAKES